MDTLLSYDWFFIATSLVKTLVIIFGVILPMVSYSVYAERRVSALIQDRLGPNRVGFPTTLLGFKKDLQLFLGGLGQPIADGLKFILKEDFTPAHVNKFYFWLAPILVIVPALLTLAVLPFGSSLDFDFIFQRIFGHGFGPVKMVIADIDVGILFVFAISSLSVYGIVLAGWSSNSKYPFLGGVRSTSQMISYELSIGLSVIPLFMIFGKLNLSAIVRFQAEHGWLLFPFTNGEFTWQKIALWVPCFISFIIFMVSVFAETNRLPFDLPEAETELVAGYHTEYSSMKFALFFLAEYTAMIAGSGLVVALFLGGWHLPFIPDGAGNGGLEILHHLPNWIWGFVNIGVFFGKVSVLIIFFIWVRWTLPRFRFDQLMRLGWIWFFEIALVNIFLTAGVLALFPN